MKLNKKLLLQAVSNIAIAGALGYAYNTITEISPSIIGLSSIVLAEILTLIDFNSNLQEEYHKGVSNSLKEIKEWKQKFNKESSKVEPFYRQNIKNVEKALTVPDISEIKKKYTQVADGFKKELKEKKEDHERKKTDGNAPSFIYIAGSATLEKLTI